VNHKERNVVRPRSLAYSLLPMLQLPASNNALPSFIIFIIRAWLSKRQRRLQRRGALGKPPPPSTRAKPTKCQTNYQLLYFNFTEIALNASATRTEPRHHVVEMYSSAAKLPFTSLLTCTLFAFNVLYVVSCFRSFAATFYFTTIIYDHSLVDL